MPRSSRKAPPKTPKTNGFNPATCNPPRLVGWMNDANKELARQLGFSFATFYRR